MHLNHQCCKIQRSTQLRQRYNPTFVHQPIFSQEAGKVVSLRCTPTYHSTALNNQGYNILTVHVKKQPAEIRPNTVLNKSIYSNFSHERRIEDLNPKCQVMRTSRDHWYDHTKEQLLGTVKNCTHRGVSRQRQQLNLASDPVFTEFNYDLNGINGPKIIATKMQHKNPEDTLVQKVVVQAPPQKNTMTQTEPQIKENQKQQAQKDPVKEEVKEKSTKNDLTTKSIPQINSQVTKRQNQKAKRPHTAKNAKIVSQNPTFTVIRKNRIQNRL